MVYNFHERFVKKIGEIRKFLENYKRVEVDVVELEDGEEYLVKLDDEDEFHEAFRLFHEKII